MTYNEFEDKLEAKEEAFKKVSIGQMSQEEFMTKYMPKIEIGLPEKFEDIVMNMCDFKREWFGLRGDGHLRLEEYQIFADEPDKVYVVFDTVFRGESDDDPRVVEFPLNIFYNDQAKKEFLDKKWQAYDRKRLEAEFQKKRKAQLDKYRWDYTTQLTQERNLRDDLRTWERLKKAYLKDEVPMIIDSLIKRGIIESEHRDDYISYVKCDLI